MISSAVMRGTVAPWLLVLYGLSFVWHTDRSGLQRLHASGPQTLSNYDPEAVGGEATAEVLELAVTDQRRNRALALRVLLPCPRPAAPAPVVVFSHGLGGSRQTSQYLGRHWAARGYAVVCPQHCGSDEAVWQEVPPEQRQAALMRAASPENARHRVDDVHAVLEQLERWTQTEGHALAGRLDLTCVGMSGHSFGALTTQMLSGQVQPAAVQAERDLCNLRIRAAIAMSPCRPAGDLQTAFGSVRIPWMMMTGSNDHAPLGYMTPANRRDVFNHLPLSVDRYELTLGGAHHFAFTDNKLPATAPRRNAQHHPTILRLSTAFWDAHLLRDPAAKRWLQGQSARSTLDPGDRWRVGIATAPTKALSGGEMHTARVDTRSRTAIVP